jgi:hypothetical protein
VSTVLHCCQHKRRTNTKKEEPHDDDDDRWAPQRHKNGRGREQRTTPQTMPTCGETRLRNKDKQRANTRTTKHHNKPATPPRTNTRHSHGTAPPQVTVAQPGCTHALTHSRHQETHDQTGCGVNFVTFPYSISLTYDLTPSQRMKQKKLLIHIFFEG